MRSSNSRQVGVVRGTQANSFRRWSLGILGLLAVASGQSFAQVCPSGSNLLPTNFVQNDNFSIPLTNAAGTSGGNFAGGSFSSDTEFVGPGKWPGPVSSPGNNKFTVINGTFRDETPFPSALFGENAGDPNDTYAGAGAFNGKQLPFPGDPANGVPASSTWMYSSGNVKPGTQPLPGSPFVGEAHHHDPANPDTTGEFGDKSGEYTVWSQNVPVTPGKTYVFYFYANNVIEAGNVSVGASPHVAMYINGVQQKINAVDDDKVIYRGDTFNSKPLNGWQRVAVTYTVPAGQTSLNLQVTNRAGGSDGDDLGLTRIGLQECSGGVAPPSPKIDVVKSTGNGEKAAQQLSSTTYLVPYFIKVGNTAAVALTNVQVNDNLANTFKAGNPSIAINEAAAVKSGLCTINPGFNGTSDTKLLAGTDTLPSNQACTISFVVRLTYPSPSAVPNSVQNNSAYASSTPSGPNPGYSFPGGTPTPPSNGVVDVSTDVVQIPVPGKSDLGVLPSPGQPDQPKPTPVDLSKSASALSISKSSSAGVARYGDQVPWRITVTNSTAETIKATKVSDPLPVGVLYVGGSSRSGGSKINEPGVVTDARGQQTLTWDVGDLAPGASFTIDFQSTLTVAFQGSTVQNSAQASGTGATSAVKVDSGRAVASVNLQAGALSGNTTVVGRVYFDVNDNNSFEEGTDIPLPGARVYLCDGRYAVTDAKGRYSIPDVEPGWCAVRLDPITAPYTPKAVPDDQGQRGTRTVKAEPGGGVVFEDFPLVPLGGAAVKARATTVMRGDVTLVKTLLQGPAGYVIQFVITVAKPIENLALTDPLPAGASRSNLRFVAQGSSNTIPSRDDGKTILVPGVLNAGTYVLTYNIATALPPHLVVTDPDINYEEVIR